MKCSLTLSPGTCQIPLCRDWGSWCGGIDIGNGILVLGIAQSCPEGVGPLEVNLDTSSFAKFLEFVCCFGNVGDYYGGLVVAVVGGVAVGGGFGGGGWCLVGMVELVLPLVKGPGRELAVVEGCFDVL